MASGTSSRKRFTSLLVAVTLTGAGLTAVDAVVTPAAAAPCLRIGQGQNNNNPGLGGRQNDGRNQGQGQNGENQNGENPGGQNLGQNNGQGQGGQGRDGRQGDNQGRRNDGLDRGDRDQDRRNDGLNPGQNQGQGQGRNNGQGQGQNGQGQDDDQGRRNDGLQGLDQGDGQNSRQIQSFGRDNRNPDDDNRNRGDFDNGRGFGNDRGSGDERGFGNARGSDNGRGFGNNLGSDNGRGFGNNLGSDNGRGFGNNRGSDNDQGFGNDRGSDDGRGFGNNRGSDDDRGFGNNRGNRGGDNNAGDNNAGNNNNAGDNNGEGNNAGGNQGACEDFGPALSDFADVRTFPRVSQPRFTANGSRGTFISRCGNNSNGHFNSDNHIVAPGVSNGAQHQHDYVGNLTTSGQSTDESLAAAGTTCARDDKSAYFWPVLRDRTREGDDANAPGGGQDGNIGRILTPRNAIMEFRGNPQSKVVAAPRFLRVITGDAKSAVNGGANARAGWTCSGFENRISGDKYPLCPRGSLVTRVLDFPSCWDGQNLDSANHRSHVVFPDDNGACPDGTQAIPQLRMTLTYAAPAGPNFAVDAFPDQKHAPITDHGDFHNVMPENLMNFVVDCINSGRRC